MERNELWNQVMKDLNKIGSHLNKVSNDDLNETDYYFMGEVEKVLTGFRNTYQNSKKGNK